MSLLSLSVQLGHPRIVSTIPASAFYPVPKVNSAVVRVDVHPTPRIQAEWLPTFFQLTKACFAQKRKTLRNSLAAGAHLSTSQAGSILMEAGIEPRRRAETLSLEEWASLCQLWEQRRSP
jgi:16S rRNA (adenine1518-N6/adenine1519-N6)-dimethyltransferase